MVETNFHAFKSNKLNSPPSFNKMRVKMLNEHFNNSF